ncbi:MAG: asparagine synthase (glutamine-hydrolyzing) [Rhodospirillales bacterium]
MCGIAGLFLPQNATILDADIDAMLATMAHRGPDGEKIYKTSDRRYQAGFKRLAIIDLKTGEQPIVENDGARVLMGNGEIYNYLELRQDLTAQHYPYRTQGDMEVVLPIAEKYGDGFVHRLNGMFALALYDSKLHCLTLVRDRLGVKPLYWTELANGGLLFASEIKALFASGLTAPAVDENAVSSYLSHGYVPAPKTLFRGIRKLPPGHMLKADSQGRITVERYWRATPSSDLPSNDAEIRDYLIESLRRSVRLHLRSDVPIGALLSGGIDSGLLVALAAENTAQPLNTFTVRFEGAAVDETKLASAVAERYQTNHTELDVSAGNIAHFLPRLAWFCEEPINDPALLPNFLVEQALGRHLKVALNGTGGDELFAGYGRYFPLPVEKRYLNLPKAMRLAIEAGMNVFSPMTAWKLARAEKYDHDRGTYLHDHSTHFPPSIRALIGNTLPASKSAQSGFFAEYDGPPQSAALYADLNTYLPDDLLTLLDRTSMAWGVEGRVPYLDHHFVEAALAVPEAIRTPQGRHKGLLRDIAGVFLPEHVASAPKQGFAAPVPAWLRAGLAPLARHLLERRETLERGWWSAEGIERLLAKPDRHGFRVYSLVMLELAIRLHIERPPTAAAPQEGLEAFADAA